MSNLYDSRRPASRFYARALASVIALLGSSALANGIIVDGEPYAYTLEIKCQVAKAVPNPNAGDGWYRSSDIGNVWFKFEPTIQPTSQVTKGAITIYRTDRFYKELVVYKNAFIMNSDSADYLIGGGDIDQADLESDENFPLSFNIDKVESQGMFYGSDKQPKYLLGRCDLFTDLAKAVGELYEQYKADPGKWQNVQWIE
ncbi:MAG: hypothetical protein WD078_04745 [Woeseia sp.]